MSRNVQETQEIKRSNRFKLIAIARLLGLLDADTAKKMVATLAEDQAIGQETRSEVLNDLLKSGQISEVQLRSLQAFCGELQQEIDQLLHECGDLEAPRGSPSRTPSAKPSSLASMTSAVPEPHLTRRVTQPVEALAVADSPSGNQLRTEGPQEDSVQTWYPEKSETEDSGSLQAVKADLLAPAVSIHPSGSDSTAQGDTAVLNRTESSTKHRSKRGGSRRRRRRDRFNDWEESWDSKIIRYLRDTPEAAFQTLGLWCARGVVWARDHLVITFTLVGLFILAIWLTATMPGMFGWQVGIQEMASTRTAASPQTQTETQLSEPTAAAPDSQDVAEPFIEPRFRADNINENAMAAVNASDGDSPSVGNAPQIPDKARVEPSSTHAGMDAFSDLSAPPLENESSITATESAEQTPLAYSELPSVATVEETPEPVTEIGPSSVTGNDSIISTTEVESETVADLPDETDALSSVVPQDDDVIDVPSTPSFPPSVTETLEHFILREAYDQAITEIQKLAKSERFTEEQINELQLVWTALLLAKADSASQELAANRLIEDSRFESQAWRLCYATFLMKSNTDQRIGILSAIQSGEFESQNLRDRLVAWVRSRNEDSTKALEILGDLAPDQCEAGDLLFRGLAYMLQKNSEAARKDMQSLLLLLNADIYQLKFSDRLVHGLCEKRLRKTALSWASKLSE